MNNLMTKWFLRSLRSSQLQRHTMQQLNNKRHMALGHFNRVIQHDPEYFNVMEKPPEASIELNKKNLANLEMLKSKSLEGGGPKGVERHVVKNKKMLVRERIKKILDEDSPFLEIGQLNGFDLPYGDVISGATITVIGKVRGVYCIIGANDATVKGGTFFPISVNKSLRAQEISQMNRLPIIYIPDSGGAFLPLQSEIFPDKKHGGRTFYNQAVLSSLGVHQVAVVCGSCTAGGAYNPTMSDEAIIVNQIGKIYLGGPPLVKAATGEIVTDEDLGGAWLHSCVSGCTDYFAKDEVEAFEMCRDIIESLNLNPIPESKSYKEPLYDQIPWNEFSSKEHLNKQDIYSILGAILDGSTFKEFKALFGQSLITGTGYIQGTMVGIVANCDEILSAEGQKGAHFIDMCSRRNIPLIFLQNSQPEKPDFDFDIEKNQIYLKDKAKMSSTLATSDVPKITLTLTSCNEDDNLLMCGPSFNPNFNFMWPSSKMSNFSMNISAEENELYREDCFYAAFNNIVDGIIVPEDTRNLLGQVLKIFQHTQVNPEVVRKAPILRM